MKPKQLFLKITLSLILSFCILQSNAQSISLNFAGDNDWVTGTNNNLPQGNAPRTIETWVKYSTSKNDMSIFNYGTFAANQKFTLHLYNGVYIIGEGNDMATGYNFNDGNWHHLAVTHNGTTTIVYVDGVIRGSKNTNYNTTGYDFQLGVSYRGGNWDFRYEGNLDEIRVWNVARTQQQIVDNMHVFFNSAPGLIACYHLNEGVPNANNTAITTVLDASGNNVNGTLNNFLLNGPTSNYVSDAAALPLRFLQFSVKGDNCQANIQWQTADESTVQTFLIEESTNGTNFSEAKRVTPKYMNGIQSYAVQLPTQPGNLFYRIKALELSGAAIYSNTIQLNTTCKQQVKTWPNPVNDVLLVQSDLTGKAYHIYNNTGEIVKAGMINTSQQRIPVANLAQGFYYIKIADSEPVRFMKY